LGDGGKVIWLANDDISLISKFGYHNQYVVNGNGGDSSTDFSLGSEPEIELGFSLPSHYAIYPYNANYGVDATENKITLDADWATQPYEEETFADDMAIMTAKSSTTNLSFKNAFSLIRFELNSEVSGSYTISSISVTSAAKALNGPAKLDMTQETPQIECVGTATENKINTLVISTPVVLTRTAKHFYLLIPAGTYPANDLTINFKGKNEMDNVDLDKSITMTSPVVCERSKMKTLTYTFEAVEFSGSTESGKTDNN
jgi:hypothetical protein